MKKNIALLYIFSIVLVLLSVFVWEFWLEQIIAPFFVSPYQPESVSERWEYVITVFVFSALALIVPTILALKIETKRQATLDSLKKLQNKTITLLDEKTIELASVKQKLAGEKYKQSATEEVIGSQNVSMQALIDSLSDSVMVIDRNYKVRMLNKAARNIHLNGLYSSETLTCHKLSHNSEHPCAGPEHECPFSKVMESGQSCTVLHHHFDSNGVNVPFEIVASPILDEDGEILGVIELARDVSSRLEREQKQREANARLLSNQRDQSISTLAGGFAHEFNNILTSILGNAELLGVRLDESDSNKKQADAIIAGTEHLADLTGQLLAYARGGKYFNQSIPINEQIDDTMRLVHSGNFADTKVEFDLSYDLWPVMGDPAQISQLIMNIVINGFEALENKEGKLFIRTANMTRTEKWQCNVNDIRPPGDYVLISVTNTGSTISKELIKMIFEPFFTTKSTGRGMGLAAAKGIVQNHNGCISVESHGDQTTFQVYLPRGVSDKELVLGEGKSPGAALGLKILVVDDEPQVLSTITSLLNHHGCIVLSADKGLEALAVIERHKTSLDMVILDIQMPDMTGDKVYTRLKEINPCLRVLISSGHEQYIALKNIQLDPKDMFIKKPFRMSDLIMEIKELTVKD